VLSTQVQGTSYSYKFSADQAAYLPADGITHDLPNGAGNYRIACTDDAGHPSVTMSVTNNGQAQSLQLTDLGGGSVKAYANGQSEIVHKR
jgi:hypothetical protein